MPSSNSQRPIELPQTELRLLLMLQRLTEGRAPDLERAFRGAIPMVTVKALLRRLEDRGLVTSIKRKSSRVFTVAPGTDVDRIVKDDIARLLRERYGNEPSVLSLVIHVATSLLVESHKPESPRNSA